MAIRQTPSGKFQVYWNNPFTGKRESVTVENRKEAEKRDALVKYQLVHERDLFRRDEATEKKPTIHCLESAFFLYLREKQFNKKSLRWQLDAMREALQMFGNSELSAITAHELKTLKALLLGKGWKGTTVRGHLSVLRTVLNWCVRNELLETIPRFPDLPKAEYEHFIPPTVDELRAMMDAAAPHIKRVIILGSQFGVRVGQSELFKLKWLDVDLVRQVIRVPAARKNVHESWREVPIRQSLLPVFREWRDSDMAAGWSGEVIHYERSPVSTIKTAWTAMLRRAGITRRIRPYDLRHAFATEAIAAGADIGTIAKLMGHRSPEMILEHYQHVMDRQKKQAVESLPDLFPHVPKYMCLKDEARAETA